MAVMSYLIYVLFLCLSLQVNAEYIDRKLAKENRNVIPLTTFGYLKGGSLEMNMSLTFHGKDESLVNKIGLRFDKSKSGGRIEYLDQYECGLNIWEKELSEEEKEIPRAILQFFTKESTTKLNIYEYKFENLTFFSNVSSYEKAKVECNETKQLETSDVNSKPETSSHKEKRDASIISFTHSTPLPVKISVDDSKWTISTSLYFHIDIDQQSGLYELYLHNCNDDVTITEGQINIIEKNAKSFLSAGEMALPTVYGVMAFIIFISGFVWAYVLFENRGKVFTIHYLMATLMFIKVLSVTFHSVDYYFIGRDGMQEAWAVIFYVAHLLKGILLFICLLLIGTGWAFIKYVLSDREKKLFMIIIPLQVIANVAYMIQGEEQGLVVYNTVTLTEVIFLIDILCFGIILISVVWSVRHLQEASQTDGKAAINLTKLRLFQQFYVMVICYLYFQRVVVYMLKITLPFRYTWIHHLVYELVSLTFFVVTGYKFRPGCDNPYLSIPQEEVDDVESHAITQSGLTETIAKVNQYDKDKSDSEEEVLLLQRNRTTFI